MNSIIGMGKLLLETELTHKQRNSSGARLPRGARSRFALRRRRLLGQACADRRGSLTTKTAVVGSAPNAAISAGIMSEVILLEAMGRGVVRHVATLRTALAAAPPVLVPRVRRPQACGTDTRESASALLAIAVFVVSAARVFPRLARFGAFGARDAGSCMRGLHFRVTARCGRFGLLSRSLAHLDFPSKACAGEGKKSLELSDGGRASAVDTRTD